MESNWEKLEKDCFKHVLDNYSDSATITSYGESDSTKPDILVTTESNSFFIEVKSNKAQCCQFVLFPNFDNCSFDYSPENKIPSSPNSLAIKNYMDHNFNTYCNVGSKGIPIPVNSSILYGWVKDFYDSKDVKFFMTKGEEFIIFPANRFQAYFNIVALYRKKTSGSRHVPKKDLNEIQKGLMSKNIEGEIEYIKIGGKTRCFIHTNLDMSSTTMDLNGNSYQFANNVHSLQVKKKQSFVFEVRKLSKTCNPNVICSLSLKKTNQEKSDLLDFIKAIGIKEEE